MAPIPASEQVLSEMRYMTAVYPAAYWFLVFVAFSGLALGLFWLVWIIVTILRRNFNIENPTPSSLFARLLVLVRLLNSRRAALRNSRFYNDQGLPTHIPHKDLMLSFIVLCSSTNGLRSTQPSRCTSNSSARHHMWLACIAKLQSPFMRQLTEWERFKTRLHEKMTPRLSATIFPSPTPTLLPLSQADLAHPEPVIVARCAVPVPKCAIAVKGFDDILFIPGRYSPTPSIVLTKPKSEDDKFNFVEAPIPDAIVVSTAAGMGGLNVGNKGSRPPRRPGNSCSVAIRRLRIAQIASSASTAPNLRLILSVLGVAGTALFSFMQLVVVVLGLVCPTWLLCVFAF